MALRAGELRHRIVIEEPREREDDFGEPVKDWQPIPHSGASAKKEDLSGRELFQAQQINARVSTRFTLRYRTDINATMRVVHGEDLYGIESVQDPDGLRTTLILTCSRGVN